MSRATPIFLQRDGSRHAGALRVLASLVFLAALLTLAPRAHARTAAAAAPTLYVNFYSNGTISVSLDDGTPIGSTAGAPTSIPAGYYQIMFSGPGGCSALPNFHLTGPGTTIVTSMSEGGVSKEANSANFLPTSTYTWTDDQFPTVVHTFATTSQIVSTPPATNTATTPNLVNKGKSVSSQDVVGSAIVPLRGTLSGTISAAGRLTLAFKGKSVGHLKAGRYRITVSDESSNTGLVLHKPSRKTLAVTGLGYMGKRSATVQFTKGTWRFALSSGKPGPGKTAYSVAVG
jgi:hypothetical protein